jgi:ABC-type proline/glycine betaine transport system permease subunit
MDLRPVFEATEFGLLTLSSYWGLKVSAETLTYVRIRGFALLVPVIFALIFREEGFVLSFLFLLGFFLVKRTGLVLSIISTVFAFTLFLLGAMVAGIALGILGTYLHVPGYEIHGTLQELLHRAVAK